MPPLDRPALKRRAQELMLTTRPRVITVGLVYLLLCIALEFLRSNVMSVNISQTEAMNYINYVSQGNYEYAMRYLEGMAPPTGAYGIDLLLSLAVSIVTVGFLIFLLNSARGKAAGYGNLLDGFGFFWKIILLDLVKGLLIGLWSLLLVVPGIVAAYRYSQAQYILIDDPTKSPLQCIRESKAMMNGHKRELFHLDLSFIGWYLLSLIPLISYAVRVWAVPYVYMSRTLFYERLLGRNVYSYSEPTYPM
ncbi:MAG: DUF975 family protein [Oscillospiraceae bacterium]|nr:DUF975 family protein [Oscillospiraceae bacterium]